MLSLGLQRSHLHVPWKPHAHTSFAKLIDRATGATGTLPVSLWSLAKLELDAVAQ